MNKSSRIYKYEIPIECRLYRDGWCIEMPKGARILTVGEQSGVLFLWALVDAEKPAELRRIFVAMTGIPLPQRELGYIGTVQMPTSFNRVFSEIVMHVFEMKEAEDDGPERGESRQAPRGFVKGAPKR